MRIFKNRAFHKWAHRQGLDDRTLVKAVRELERGLVDADMGGHVMKKRVAVGARGKSGGLRTLLVYKTRSRAFFIYGFAKNARSNINVSELKALRALAKELLAYNDVALDRAVREGALIEVKDDG